MSIKLPAGPMAYLWMQKQLSVVVKRLNGSHTAQPQKVNRIKCVMTTKEGEKESQQYKGLTLKLTKNKILFFSVCCATDLRTLWHGNADKGLMQWNFLRSLRLQKQRERCNEKTSDWIITIVSYFCPKWTLMNFRRGSETLEMRQLPKGTTKRGKPSECNEKKEIKLIKV